MRRMLAIIAAVTLGALALVQVEPSAPNEPGLGFSVPIDPGGAIGDQSLQR